MPISRIIRAGLAAASILGAVLAPLSAEENFEGWSVLKRTFPSTGGGGVMIDEYDPIIVGNKCVTDFTATEPDGKIYYNTIEFDAVPAQGGTLCINGKWRARDGSMAGTTPFRVFFKDGVVRGSPLE
jgi:hypothetical protein